MYSQSEYLVPRGRQRLVLRVRLQSGVDQFEHAKGVGLAAQIGGRQPVGFVHADREHADVEQVAKRPADRVLLPDVFLFRDLVFVVGQVRHHGDRRRAADGQQQVQYATDTRAGSVSMLMMIAAAAIVTAAADVEFVFDFVRFFAFQFTQVHDGAINRNIIDIGRCSRRDGGTAATSINR